MFESVTLERKISNEEYSKLGPNIRSCLFDAQRAAHESNKAVLIIMCGIECSGRGETVNMLSEWMDAKLVKNHTFWLETDEERHRPYEWRFWRKLPKNGEIGIFFGAWYDEVIKKHACGKISDDELSSTIHRFAKLENTLVDSGLVIVKIWLHINKKRFKKRIKERLESNSFLAFSKIDKKAVRSYDETINAASKAITITDTVSAPWTIVDAYDSNFRNVSVAKAIIGAISQSITSEPIRKKENKSQKPPIEITNLSSLDKTDLSLSISHEKYTYEMNKLHEKIRYLTFEAYKKGISSTLVFEGWDAAGKGGAIRRLSNSIDARIMQVIQISAPTDEELAHHYLWRFWRNIPMDGFVTIYDRSWYGRVLVERVENFASHEEWARSYSEINDFEEQLVDNKNILLKFWLHISEDEQLKRFKEREEITWKNYKITPDDWRNREKHDDYLIAADEMFAKTSTLYAPWHVIAAEDKKYARISVMRIYAEALEKALKKL